MAPGALAQVLREIPTMNDPNVLVGLDTSDDACVYRVSDDVALIETVDFFPPMVDDPFVFGQIAAANALSDVYAMGGTPVLAMNILCFPNCLGVEVAGQIIAGGADKAREAGVTVAGGHTLTDDEPKYGMCVTGMAHPDRILKNSSARPGDALVLTKELGTGLIMTALKGELVAGETVECAVESMRTLNRYAAECARGLAVHACTDVTGFGLAGHLCEMAEGSGLTATVSAGAFRLLPEALEMARMGVIPAGAYRNADHFGAGVVFDDDVENGMEDVLFDPQTSGGLLFALPPADAETLLARLQDAGVPAALVGTLSPYEGHHVHVRA